jgi:hypothetical protein
VSGLNEDQLRAMVRESIARALGQPPERTASATAAEMTRHTSHFRYLLPESEGPCLIEPTVQCTHCGYCQSHGH